MAADSLLYTSLDLQQYLHEDPIVINRRTFVKTGAAALPAAYLATQGNLVYAGIPQDTAEIPWQRKLRRIA